MIGARLPVVALPDPGVHNILVKPSFDQEVIFTVRMGNVKRLLNWL